MSAKTAGYSATPFILGPKPLWNKPGFKLPDYIENVAKGLIESGHDRSEAIQIAIGVIKNWAAGGGKVTPEVQAASAKALAEWEKLKAEAGGGGKKSEHAGSAGNFVELNVVASPAGESKYNLPIGTPLGQNGQPATDPRIAALSTPDLQKVASLAATMPASTPGLAAAQQQISAELANRGVPLSGPGTSGAPKSVTSAAATAAKAASVKQAAATKAAVVQAAAAKKAAAAQAAAAKKAAAAQAAAAKKAAAVKAAAARKAAAAAKKAATHRASVAKKASGHKTSAAKKSASKAKAAAKTAAKANASAYASDYSSSRVSVDLVGPQGYEHGGRKVSNPQLRDRYGNPVHTQYGRS
jgi:hypothetical protein